MIELFHREQQQNLAIFDRVQEGRQGRRMRLDDEDFIDFGNAPWIYGPDRAFMRKLQIPKSKLKALQTANMLEVWITAPQLNQHLNPSMAFRLESLRPLVRAVSKISDR